jgi:Fe-S cluster assembly protein SufD
VRALSSFKDEPEWLAEKRLSAWRAFEALPMPTLARRGVALHGHLRRAHRGLPPLRPEPDAESEGDLPEAVQKLIEEGEENSPCSSSTTPRRLTAAWTTR